MRRVAKLLGFVLPCAIICLSITLPAAHAEFYINNNKGGQIGNFLTGVATIRESGQTVRIRGRCLSACTLITMLPRNRLCVELGATLGFHAAWMPGQDGKPVTSQKGTQLLWDAYPAPIKRWVKRHGGLTRHMIYLRGRALLRLYPRCKHPVSARALQAFTPGVWAMMPSAGTSQEKHF